MVAGDGHQVDGDLAGIGRAIALIYAREGASVLVADNLIEAAERTCTQIRAEGGVAHAFQMDIRNEQDCIDLAMAARSMLGGLDVLHNNVVADAELLLLDVATFDGIMVVNLRGMWLTCKHLLPLVRESGNASIINTSSIASVLAGRYDMYAAYRMSKAGVNALTTMLAMGYGKDGIRANALLVGPIETVGSYTNADLRGDDRSAIRQRMVVDMPLPRRPGNGWDVAHASAFLASDDAGYITGAFLSVDGGLTTKVR